METTHGPFDRITIDPGRLDGRTCIRGYRFSVEHLVELVAAGWSVDEVRAEFPFVEAEDIRQAVRFAGASRWAVDGDLEGVADGAHAEVAQAAEAGGEPGD